MNAGYAEVLQPSLKHFAKHDLSKILTEPALSLATGRNFASAMVQLSNEPEVDGPIASARHINRLFNTQTAVTTEWHLAMINKSCATAGAHL